jgi:hypothetical protein
MKKLFVSTFLILSITFFGNTQNTLGIGKGSKIVYVVTNPDGKKYDFTMTIKSMDATGIAFDWQTSNGKKGSTKLNSDALENATTMTSDVKSVVKNISSLFLSRKSYKELNDGGKTNIIVNKEAKPTTFQKVMLRNYDYMHNGTMKTVAVTLGAREKSEKTRIVLVLNDIEMPLLMALDWDVRMTLKSIDTM